MLQTDTRQGGGLRVRKDLLARLDLEHAFALLIISIRNPLLKRQNHSSSFVLNAIRRTTSRTSRARLLAGPSGSSLRYASRSWSCISYSPLRAWTLARIR